MRRMTAIYLSTDTNEAAALIENASPRSHGLRNDYVSLHDEMDDSYFIGRFGFVPQSVVLIGDLRSSHAIDALVSHLAREGLFVAVVDEKETTIHRPNDLAYRDLILHEAVKPSSSPERFMTLARYSNSARNIFPMEPAPYFSPSPLV